MKKHLLPLYILGGLSVFYGCKSDINERTENLNALAPASQDVNAGSWKPVLLSSATEIQVAAPADPASASYKNELNDLRTLQKNISSDQQKKITYWAAGGVLRWNELMRELVARYNLPPHQNDDGTYPIPAAANPFAYPLFPFANPPYAARAYAYISAAQYDALVATWFYKMKYKRLAPYKNDSGIEAKVTQTDLPSYPSEAAVLAGVTAEMMKLLFPTEIDNIAAKAKEHELCMKLAGAATQSDIDAGEALGRAVAQKFITRARTDRAGAAVGNQVMWTKLETDCIARGEKPWYSLETPKRPPMLPAFGNVRSLMIDSATMIAMRPGPPPTTDGEQMKKETAEIYSFVKNPTPENIRITQFWADGVGTYTPPGHWNSIAADDFVKKNFSEVRWARNMALLNMALMDAGIICWNTKYFFFNPRPTQMNPAIKTLTGIPNFPAYISGHSTFSGAAATILGYLVPERAEDYRKMAQEASLSRMVAGIHFRSDCEVGIKVGNNVGVNAINRARTDGAQ
ncbi:MAG: phosphatase PAP2 family protein [Mucilaginibacter polytrichastri]|nr:phosphatase PAP2 family protein [Mucilaginibacter polytrichastri]